MLNNIATGSARDFDAVMSALLIPETPPQGIAFTHPYLEVGQVLMVLVDEKAINPNTAKRVLETMYATGDDPHAIVQREGLAMVSDTGTGVATAVPQAATASASSRVDSNDALRASARAMKRGNIVGFSGMLPQRAVAGERRARALAPPGRWDGSW